MMVATRRGCVCRAQLSSGIHLTVGLHSARQQHIFLPFVSGLSVRRTTVRSVKCGEPSKKVGPRKPRGGKRGCSPSSEADDTLTKRPYETMSSSTTAKLTVPDDPELAARVEPFAFDLSLLPERFVREVGHNFECPVCKNILDRPMAVPVPGCEHACSWECREQWLAQSPT